MSWLDLLSWSAIVIVLISFFHRGNKLRILSVIGSVMFLIWASFLGLYQVIFVNSCIALINIYKLYTENKI